MRLDIYLTWDEDDSRQQAAPTTAGHLTELAAGDFLTRALVPEAFRVRLLGWDAARAAGLDVDASGAVLIPAAALRDRLAAACAGVPAPYAYTGALALPSGPTAGALSDFVDLAERLDAEDRQPRVLLQVDY